MNKTCFFACEKKRPQCGPILRPFCGHFAAILRGRFGGRFLVHVLLDSYLRGHFGGHNAGQFWRPFCGTILAATMRPLFFAVVFRQCAFWRPVGVIFGRGPRLRSRVSFCSISRIHCRNAESPGEFGSHGVSFSATVLANSVYVCAAKKSSNESELHTFSLSDLFFVQKADGV